MMNTRITSWLNTIKRLIPTSDTQSDLVLNKLSKLNVSVLAKVHRRENIYKRHMFLYSTIYDYTNALIKINRIIDNKDVLPPRLANPVAGIQINLNKWFLDNEGCYVITATAYLSFLQQTKVIVTYYKELKLNEHNLDYTKQRHMSLLRNIYNDLSTIVEILSNV